MKKSNLIIIIVNIKHDGNIKVLYHAVKISGNESSESLFPRRTFNQVMHVLERRLNIFNLAFIKWPQCFISIANNSAWWHNFALLDSEKTRQRVFVFILTAISVQHHFAVSFITECRGKNFERTVYSNCRRRTENSPCNSKTNQSNESEANNMRKTKTIH